MTCDPHWTQYLSALLVPTVAVFGSIIAYRQWRTSQNKLKLELFEKRFEVYDSARKLLASIMTTGKSKGEETFKFLVGTREAKWLLNEDIAEYLEKQLYHKAIELQTLDAELEGVPVGEERTTNVHRQSDIKKWMYAQFEVLDKKFSSFLKLEH